MKSTELGALFLVGFLLLTSSEAYSRELPLVDLAQMKLRVVNTEMVDQIEVKGEKPLTAKSGMKLVVVTLEGVVTDSCRYVVSPKDFSAVFEVFLHLAGESYSIDPKTAKRDRKPSTLSNVTACRAMKQSTSSKDSWQAEGVTNVSRGPGSVTFQVVFSLMESVKSFIVRYPAFAVGDARVE